MTSYYSRRVEREGGTEEARGPRPTYWYAETNQLTHASCRVVGMQSIDGRRVLIDGYAQLVTPSE